MGLAEDIGLRLWEHFKMENKTGSAWTKKYRPISVIHCSKHSGSMSYFKRVEQQSTLRLAKLKGFANVRGGGFSLTTDDYPKSWDERLVNVPPANIDSMKPIDKNELKQLMKGKYNLWRKKRLEGIEKKKHNGCQR